MMERGYTVLVHALQAELRHKAAESDSKADATKKGRAKTNYKKAMRALAVYYHVSFCV